MRRNRPGGPGPVHGAFHRGKDGRVALHLIEGDRFGSEQEPFRIALGGFHHVQIIDGEVAAGPGRQRPDQGGLPGLPRAGNDDRGRLPEMRQEASPDPPRQDVICHLMRDNHSPYGRLSHRRAAADGPLPAGTGTAGQFSRWGPAQPAGGGRSRVSPHTGMVLVSALSPSQKVAFPCAAALPLSQHCAARPAPRGGADQRSAQFSRWGLPCLRVAPPGGMGAMRQFSVRVAPSATRRALPRLRNPG